MSTIIKKSKRFIKVKQFNESAMKSVASVYGLLVGLAGIEHGIFEILKGDIPTEGLLIDAISDAYRFWPGGKETALSIIPNYLWTGILAVIFGVLVVIWSVAFTQRKYGASIFLLLTVTLFLVGGGFAPIFVSILAVAAATRINKPLNWWREHLPVKEKLTQLWPAMLIVFVIVFWGAVGIQIFGLPTDAVTTTSIMQILSILMITLLPITVLVGLAYDLQSQSLETKQVQV